MIGNYGVPDDTVKDLYGLPAFFESTKIHVAGLIVDDYAEKYRCGVISPAAEEDKSPNTTSAVFSSCPCRRNVSSIATGMPSDRCQTGWRAKACLASLALTHGQPGAEAALLFWLRKLTCLPNLPTCTPFQGANEKAARVRLHARQNCGGRRRRSQAALFGPQQGELSPRWQ